MKRKVVIVGAGAVGSTYAYAMAHDGTADEIVLVDVNRELAEGEALDLAHGMPFIPHVRIRAGEPEDYRDADVIVLSAGAKQKPGESRLNLLQRNAEIVRHIVKDIDDKQSRAVLVVVANPVDILTRAAQHFSGLDNTRVIGSGTVLDSARFRYLLSRHCGVDARNVHAYILGEHGDSEMAPWSMTHIAGIPMAEYCAICGRCEDWTRVRRDIVEQVRNSAYHLIDYKGATNYAIGLALVRITRTILRDEHSVLTVSVRLGGEYGLNGVCLSVPCLLSAGGIERIIECPLLEEEKHQLHRSAEVLEAVWKDVAATLQGA